MTRFGRITATSAVVLGVGLTVLFCPAPRLIWNASASVPIGLYAVRPAGALHVDELLVVMPPEPLATFLDERRYLPRGVPLLKHVLALPGQTVCRADRTITIDGVAMGEALDRDHLRRPLPFWHGCRVIAGGDVRSSGGDHRGLTPSPPSGAERVFDDLNAPSPQRREAGSRRGGPRRGCPW
jgi:type IV secretory pathway protease TraF